MNRLIKWIAGLASLLLIASCDAGLNNNLDIKNADGTISADGNKILYPLRNDVTVEASAVETIKYEDATYSYLDSVTSYSLNREYALLKDQNQKETKGVRVLTDNGVRTYLSGENGLLTYQSLDKFNKVQDIQVISAGLTVPYSSLYDNPFDYIFSGDIDAQGNLTSNKASFILDKLFDLDYSVNSSTFSLNPYGFATGLVMDVASARGAQIVEPGVPPATFIKSLTVDIKFSYDQGGVKLVTPRSQKQEALSLALNAMGENYTIALTSDGLAQTVVYYVTDQGIYSHLSGYSIGYADGDTYYSKNSDGTYKRHTYSLKDYTWSPDNLAAPLSADDILPSYASIDASIFEKEGENSYSISPEAAPLASDALNLPSYSFQGTEGTGFDAHVVLENGKISSVSSISKTLSASVAVNEAFSNYGTTQFPSWIDINQIVNG